MPRTCLDCRYFDRLFSCCEAHDTPVDVVETEAEECAAYSPNCIHDEGGHVMPDHGEDEYRRAIGG